MVEGIHSPLNIQPSDYEYEPDKKALEKLDGYTELKNISEYFIKEVSEPWFSAFLAGNCVKSTKVQLPNLFETVSELSSVLQVPTPQVFIQQDPRLNAFTLGINNFNCVVITHSLFKELKEPELRFVIGHELGHIKSNHVLYNTILHWLVNQPQSLGNSTKKNLLPKLYNWKRNAEITADRAGLIVVQDINAASLALVTLAIGTHELSLQVNIDEYVSDQILSLKFNPSLNEVLTQQTHPFIPVRIKALKEFYNSQRYRKLLNMAVHLEEDAGDLEIKLE